MILILIVVVLFHYNLLLFTLFLVHASDFIPQKVKAEDALAEISKAEAETDS